MNVRALLLPGEALMNRLRFAPKLLLILVLVVIPLIAFTVFYLFDLSRQLETVEQELRGAAFIQPVAISCASCSSTVTPWIAPPGATQRRSCG